MSNIAKLSNFFEMRCPKCHKVLVAGEKRKYETLSDHVFDPNGEDRPLRTTYTCSCVKGIAYWDESGAIYIQGNYKDFSIVFPYGKYYSALFSWDWFYKTFDEKIFWFMFKFRDRVRVLKGKKSIFAKAENK